MRKWILFFATMAVSSVVLAFDHNHSDWTQVLKGVVKSKGPVSEVDYKALPRLSVTFVRYVDGLSKVKRTQYEAFTPDQKKAFLINAYNAFTLKLINDHYPVKSIKDIGGLLKSPWKIKFIRLFGGRVHLDHIEHEMLRKNFDDPRVHFAVNCASVGCPALRKEAYVPDRLNEQLEEQTKTFLRDQTRNRFDVETKTLVLSKIFDWFEEDFTKNGQSVHAFVATRMTDDPETQKLLNAGDFSISYSDYDWGLNVIK